MAISHSTNSHDHAAALDAAAFELSAIDAMVSILGVIDENSTNADEALIHNAGLERFCNTISRKLEPLFESIKNAADAFRAGASQAANADELASHNLSPEATLQSYQIACDPLSADECAVALKRHGWAVTHDTGDIYRVSGEWSLHGLRSMLAQERFAKCVLAQDCPPNGEDIDDGAVATDPSDLVGLAKSNLRQVSRTLVQAQAGVDIDPAATLRLLEATAGLVRAIAPGAVDSRDDSVSPETSAADVDDLLDVQYQLLKGIIVTARRLFLEVNEPANGYGINEPAAEMSCALDCLIDQLETALKGGAA